MAYIGAPPQNRVLSSDDIAQGAVTLNDINFTDQPTNMDITGVIDKHTMRLADGVTITGDVTISDDLVLSKISDDGNAITMTNDGSSRTITGSGSIEASTLSQTPNQSLTGMTGDIGSAVTGGAGLSVTGMTGTLGSVVNLGNATFPTGTMVLIGNKTITAGGASTSSLTYVATGLGTASRDMDITIPASTVALYSKIIVVFSHMLGVNASTFALADTTIYRNNVAWSLRHIVGAATSVHSNVNSITRVAIDTSLPSSGDVTYSYRIKKHGGVPTGSASYAGTIAVLGAETNTDANVLAYGCV